MATGERVARTEHERKRSRPEIIGAGIFALWLSAACAGDARQSFVDCREDPKGSAAILMYPKNQEIVLLGDAVARPNGSTQWRDTVTLTTNGSALVVAAAGRAASTFSYEAVFGSADRSIVAVQATQEGNKVTVAIVEDNPPPHGGSLAVEYTC